MEISLDMKKAEAVRRMKMLGVFGQAREKFRRSGKVMVSEPPFGGLYDLNERQKEVCKKLLDENGALVYLVIRSFCEDMEMESYLYVSDHEEEWELDRADIRDKFAVTWTENLNYPEYSEFGSIGFRSFGGGLLRTA